MSAAATVVAFDFDGTLTTRDTVVPFLRRFSPASRIGVLLVRHTFRLLPIVVRRDRDKLRALVNEIVFTGRNEADVVEQARLWGCEIAEGGLRSDTTARLGWHLTEGHRVVIVSASYEPYIKVVADKLGQIDVLATRLEVVNGRCSGRLDGANCRGAEKVRRLEQWLHREGLERDGITLYGYGDSNGDRELLAYVDHPHWVNDPLASVAP